MGYNAGSHISRDLHDVLDVGKRTDRGQGLHRCSIVRNVDRPSQRLPLGHQRRRGGHRVNTSRRRVPDASSSRQRKLFFAKRCWRRGLDAGRRKLQPQSSRNDASIHA